MLIKKNGLVFGAIILTFAGLFAKFIGAFYKIPLTHILGSTGIGIYYLIFPLYSMLLVLSSSGIAIALTKKISTLRIKSTKKNREKEFQYLSCSLILTFIISFVFGLLLVILCKEISILQGNINAYMGYIVIAPALVISSIIAIIRAYFQGIENMIPTSLSIIIEQIIKMFAGLILAKLLVNMGIVYAVLGAIIGVCVSELVALFIMVINFINYKIRLDKNHIIKASDNDYSKLYSGKKFRVLPVGKVSYRYIFFDIIKTSLPNTFSMVILPLTGAIDSYLVISLLINSGLTSTLSTSLYGLNYGIVSSLIGIAVIIINGLSTAIMPNLSRILEIKGSDDGLIKSGFYIKLTWYISICIVVLFIIFAKEIIQILYSNALNNNVVNELDITYTLLIVSTISIIYYSFLSAFTTILQSIGKFFCPLIGVSVSLILRIFITIILIKNPLLNVMGGVIANILFLALSCIICVYFVKLYLPLTFSIYRMLVLPLFCGAVLFLVCFILKNVLLQIANKVITVCLCGAVGVVIYILLLVWLKGFSDREKRLIFNNKKHLIGKE